MFDESLDLSEVLRGLKSADDALTEFVAPLWPGVAHAAVWIEGQPRLFHLPEAIEYEGYQLLGTDGDRATPVRPADAGEIRRFLSFLPTARVILLEDGLAYPATFAERLQGITDPWPIVFAFGQPLEEVTARFDGLNLFGEEQRTVAADNPLAGLFGASSIFTPGELLDLPAGGAAEDAQQVLETLLAHPEQGMTCRLTAMLRSAGAELLGWSQTTEVQVRWRRLDEERITVRRTFHSPITTGICLPGARTFNHAAFARLLVDHILDTW